MDKLLKSVLQEVKQGRTRFAPSPIRNETLETFQEKAQKLEQANQKGLFVKCRIHRESSTGHRHIDTVLITGGLSLDGEQYLESLTEPVEIREASVPIEQESHMDTPTIISRLEKALATGEKFQAERADQPGAVQIWLGQIRVILRDLYGPQSEAYALWPANEKLTPEQAERAIRTYLPRAKALYAELQQAHSSLRPPRVFIGHGHSEVWRALKDHIKDEFGIYCDEFNSTSVAGVSTTERLQTLLESATFAFLVLTAEDQHADETLHPRENVVHEAGLFQGRLGNKRAIMLVEDGCSTFSNVHGLTVIDFPKNKIEKAFYEVSRVLKREGLIQ